jgi:hypothetical protein
MEGRRAVRTGNLRTDGSEAVRCTIYDHGESAIIDPSTEQRMANPQLGEGTLADLTPCP